MIQVENKRRPAVSGFIDIMKNTGERREPDGDSRPDSWQRKPTLFMSKAVLRVK